MDYEIEALRKDWLLATSILLFILSIKILVVWFLRWGNLKQCIFASLLMDAASSFIPILWGVSFILQYSDISLLPGTILYVQQMFFFVFIPLSIMVEGIVLMLLRRGVITRKPWKTAIFANFVALFIRSLI